jgi:hypothetical protein
MKFRSQTPDKYYGQMKQQRWEETEKRKEKKPRRERARRKKSKVCKEVEKSRNTVFSNVLQLRRVEK